MSDSAVVELPLSRGPGAPKGRPKPVGSGRRPGVKNKVTREIRVLAGKYSLRALRHTWKLAQEAQDQTVQLKALELLLAYAHGKPSQTTLIGGDGGDPLKLQQVQDLMADPEETARRVSLLLYAGDPNYRAAADAEREARNRGGRQDNFPESFNGARAPADESDGSEGSDTPDGETASQQTPEGAEESTEPTPPPEGKSLSFGAIAIRNDGPQRPGLPPTFAVCRAGLAIQQGNWAVCLALAEKLVGPPLPPGKLAETRPDGALSWPSPREQRSSGPRRL